jgi:hypothetical protein
VQLLRVEMAAGLRSESLETVRPLSTRSSRSLTPKKVAARIALKKLAVKARTVHGPEPAPASACVAKLDRIQGYCRQNPTAAVRGIPGFKSIPGHRINPPAHGRFQPYGYVHWFESCSSGMKLLVESARREAWLPPYRLTLYADDRTGLLPSEVFAVLEVLPDFRLSLLELAFDFDSEQMDRKFVRNHGLFGKSRPARPEGETDYWGTRRGSKRVQAYVKEF